MNKKKLSTNLIKAGINRSKFMETSDPLFLTSGFIYESAEEAEKSFKEEEKKDLCIQDLVTLQLKHFKKKWRSWKKLRNVGEQQQEWQHFLQFLCHTLKSGDRVVSSKALFGSCHHIVTQILPRFGIEVVLVDGTDLNQWEKALKKKTNIVFFETPSNPCLDLVDIKEVSNLAHKARCLSCC